MESFDFRQLLSTDSEDVEMKHALLHLATDRIDEAGLYNGFTRDEIVEYFEAHNE
jgi:hypothetical protein